MPKHKKLNGFLPSIAVITVVLAVFGWMLTRMEKIDEKADLSQANISSVNIDIKEIKGDLKTIGETLRWLEKQATEFQEKNGGTLNMEKFIESLLTAN